MGIYAATADGAAAGTAIVDSFRAPVEIMLQPTSEYRGRLLSSGDAPVTRHAVRAVVRVEGYEDYKGTFLHSFEAATLRAKTDDNGRFTLRGIPTELPVTVFAAPTGINGDSERLDQVFLEPGEVRPEQTIHIGPRNDDQPIQLAEDFRRKLRDCLLNGYRLLVITAVESEQVSQFIDENLIDYTVNSCAYSFIQLRVPMASETPSAELASLLDTHNCTAPAPGHLLAIAFDSEGTAAGQLQLDVAHPEAAASAAAFLEKHSPETPNADDKWAAAFAEARRTSRKVWMCIGQRYCSPCFKLSRWMDDQKDILSKDYVMLKVDNFRDLGGRETASRLTLGRPGGIPFWGIFSRDEELLADSIGPLGNVGMPNDSEGRKLIRNVLRETRQSMTDTDIEHLLQSLE